MTRWTSRRLWRYWIMAAIIPAYFSRAIDYPEEDVFAANMMLLSLVVLMALVAMIVFFRSESYLSKGRIGAKFWFVASVCSLSWYLSVWKNQYLPDFTTIHSTGWLLPVYCCSSLLLGCLSHILQIRRRFKKNTP